MKGKKIAGNIFKYFIMIFTIAVSVFPILWVIMSSFKSNGEILSGPFTLPSQINFDAYVYLFEKYDFLTYTLNSVIVSIVPTLISLLFFTMGAYVIAKYQFRGKGLFYALFTVTLLVPAHSRTQPIFSLISNMGLYNTKTGLMLVYLSSGMAMSMFILKAAFQSVPDELTEAARLDGASFFKVFWKVNLPLAKNGLVTAGVLMFLANWNEFYYANLLITSPENRTLPVITILFNSMFAYNYTNTFAALTVVVIPGIIIYAFAQKQVQQGLASSAVKG
ncbi:carbohydrate ABC transporter permease [Faecalicatena orotica]|uniref:carbohydrate ABC transporter permease n=1 Tax=Clostridia TaxID=186801 RepID=UPI0026AB3CC9